MTDSAFINDLVILFIQVIAYVGPFFLIPAVFKTGMGAFGNLVGMVNDRGRGLFDRNKKYRQGKMSNNWQKAKVGERYNSRGLNALTSRATTKNLGFGAKGSAAYQQKMANSGIGFGKSEEAQAIQHNDDALRALTYGSSIEAKQNMANDFGLYKRDSAGNIINKAEADSTVDKAIAAAQASGGFGRNRQLFAAAQLSRTGTGYDSIDQVAQTIARVSHGNEGQAAALAGDINASTKQASRYDLAPGFGALNNLAQAEMSGDPVGSSADAYHAATVKAARGADPVTLLRGKSKQVETLTKSLAANADAQRRIMETKPVGSTEHTNAQEEFLQTMGQIDQLNQSKSYASQENQEHVNALFNETDPAYAQRYKLLDDVLGQPGTKIDPGTGKRVPRNAAPTAEQDAARRRWGQVNSPRINPNDPNNS